jgi:transposase-like protein
MLGLWVEQTEGAKFWLRIVNELRNRGVNDILIAVVDGLKGFPEAINAAFPQTQVQTCIVHLLRTSLAFVSWADRREVVAALKPIYTAATADAALLALDAFEAGPWGRKYPAIAPAWRRQWQQVIPFFAYPPEVRRIIYTTDEIDKSVFAKSLCFSVRSKWAVFLPRPGSESRRGAAAVKGAAGHREAARHAPLTDASTARCWPPAGG